MTENQSTQNDAQTYMSTDDDFESRAASRTYQFLGKTPDEAARLAQRYVAEADNCQYWLGVPDAADVPTLIFILEAARNLCGMNHEAARELLDSASQRLGWR